MRVLILGGTGDANRLANTLAAIGIDAVYSYAGRTDVPVPQPLPTRKGGFGGAAALAAYLQDEAITHVVDATHPFAVEMSRNAAAACAIAAVPLVALERPAWIEEQGDTWIRVPDLDAAVRALPDAPANIFLAIGRQHISPFAAKSQHAYTLRFVDPPRGDLPLPNADVLVDRGPFTLESETRLMTSRAIHWVVSRNSGGTGARAKLDAARALGLPVVMIERPAVAQRQSTTRIDDVLAWLGHEARLGA